MSAARVHVQELPGPDQRPQHAVEDAAEQARAELGPQRVAGRDHRVAGAEAARVLVHLHGGDVAVEGDHLAGQLAAADLDEIEHRRSAARRPRPPGR